MKLRLSFRNCISFDFNCHDSVISFIFCIGGYLWAIHFFHLHRIIFSCMLRNLAFEWSEAGSDFVFIRKLQRHFLSQEHNLHLKMRWNFYQNSLAPNKAQIFLQQGTVQWAIIYFLQSVPNKNVSTSPEKKKKGKKNKKKKKKNKFAVTQSNSKVDLFWPYSKINLAGLTAFSFQATVSATDPLHSHWQQERHWYLCMRFHDTVHMRENSLVHAYGSCTLQRHSQLHSCSGSSWARTLEQPVDRWSQQSPGYR